MKKAILFSLLPALVFLLSTSSILTKNVGKANPETVAASLQTAAFEDILEEIDAAMDNSEAMGEVAGEATFQDFLKKFRKKSLPFSVNTYQLANKLKKATVPESTESEGPKNALSYEYSHFLVRHGGHGGGMSRIPEFIVPLHRFENESFVAVTYAIEHGFSEMYRREYVAAFEKSGKYLGTHDFARFSPTEIVAVELAADLLMNSKTYHVKWKNDVEKKGYEGNEITGLDFLHEKTENATNPSRVDLPMKKGGPKKPAPAEKTKTVGAK